VRAGHHALSRNRETRRRFCVADTGDRAERKQVSGNPPCTGEPHAVSDEWQPERKSVVASFAFPCLVMIPD
jgi:hypothetical protein